jgi:competence protein ComEA
MRQAGYILVGLLAGFLLAGALVLVTRLPGGNPVTLAASPTKVPIEVNVIGAVLRPGLYSFADGSRVQDAITAAGGLRSEADLNAMNLAAKLEDGQQLNVPFVAGAGSNPTATAAFQVLPGLVTPTSSAGKININQASAEELDQFLPGIGPTLAQQIVDYRTAHGAFTHIEDIMHVDGIGPSIFDNIQALITVQ